MKKNLVTLMILFVVFCFGCATIDTGFYVKTESIAYKSNEHEIAHTKSVIKRSFVLPPKKDIISPRKRSALIGHWRCKMNIDSQMNMWGGYNASHLSYLEEYEFRDDGSFSKWRISKMSNTAIPESEEKGHWEYHDEGVLHISREYGLSKNSIYGIITGSNHCQRTILHQNPDIFDKAMPFIMDYPFDYFLEWHSETEFTPKKRNINENANGLLPNVGLDGVYDEDGCYWMEKAMGTTDMVVMPLRFIKVNK